MFTCRRTKLARLLKQRAEASRQNKLAKAQAAARAALGDRALIPPAGKSRFLYRP